MEQVRKAMDQAVEEMLPVMIEYAKRIVSFETTVGNEAAAQAYVSEVLRKNGFEVDMWTPDAAAMQQKRVNSSISARPNSRILAEYI